MPTIEFLDSQFTGPDTFKRIVHKLPRTDYTTRFLASQYAKGNVLSLPSLVGAQALTAGAAAAARQVRDVDGVREIFLNADGLVWTGFVPAQPYTLVLRIKFPNAATANKTILDGGAPFTLRRLGNGTLAVVVGGGNAAVSAPVDAGVWHTVIVQVQDDNGILSVNGAEALFDAGAALGDHLYLGTSGGGDVFSVRELVRFNGTLSLAERQAFVALLAKARA